MSDTTNPQSPAPSDIEKRLDKLLESIFSGELYDYVHGAFIKVRSEKDIIEARTQIYALITDIAEAVIGEDEPTSDTEEWDDFDEIKANQNDLRAAQRARLTKLTKRGSV